MIIQNGMTRFNKTFWEKRYNDGHIGWDLGKASKPIEEYAKTLSKDITSLRNSIFPEEYVYHRYMWLQMGIGHVYKCCV